MQYINNKHNKPKGEQDMKITLTAEEYEMVVEALKEKAERLQKLGAELERDEKEQNELGSENIYIRKEQHEDLIRHLEFMRKHKYEVK